MTSYSRGDIVLVPFPFAELTGTKKRPALVISSGEYNRRNRAAVIVLITSKVDAHPRVGDYKIVDWKKAGLLAPSLLRAHLATVKEGLILRKLGELQAADTESVNENLATILGLSSVSRE